MDRGRRELLMSDTDRPRPLITELAPGKHAVCACGGTQTPPHCDGSHAGTEHRPDIVDVDKLPMNIAWCTCRASGKMPYCDGSHRQFWDDPRKPPPEAGVAPCARASTST